MIKAKKLAQRGFTLIELMIVVVIIGILASLAIYGVQKYVANSKSAEARMMLGRMSKDAVGAYEAETMDSGILAPGASAKISQKLCPDAGATIPTAIASVSAKKYQPNPDEWNNAGWKCLGTAVNTPIYFMYNYDVTVDDADKATNGDTFSAIAYGDLDGDATTSKFNIDGAIVKDNSGSLTLTVAPTVQETNPEE